VVATTGAPALATTSAGIAWSLGLPDGGGLGREEALASLARIVGVAGGTPVSADLEDGYGDSPAETAASVAVALELGVVGVNLEDERRSPEQFAAHLAAVRAACGSRVFINARTDIFLAGAGHSEQLVSEALRRGRLYLGAGADGVFVPAAASASAIAALAGGLDAPLNVTLSPGGLSPAELAALGVARISWGSSLAESAHSVVRDAAAALRGGSASASPVPLGYAQLNALF